MEADRKCSQGGWVLMGTSLLVAAALFGPVTSPQPWHDVALWVRPGQWENVAALGLMALGFWLFRRRYWPRNRLEGRRLRNVLLLICLQAVLLRGVLEVTVWMTPLLKEIGSREFWLWAPWFLGPGLTAILVGGRLGVLSSLAGIFFLYLLGDPGPLPLVGCLISSLVGLVLLRRCPTRRRVFRASWVSGGVLALVAVGVSLANNLSPAWTAICSAIPLGVAFVTGFAILILLPLLEGVLGELSDLSLVEYGSDHPLLDQLKEQAPGTWHHTLNVADLAEKAAVAMGARGLFCRTAAFYHDVGKLKDPGMFAENIEGPSPHKDLDPCESAQRIIDHVRFGLELARKYRLPKAFRDIIAEHHGTTVVRCFYVKACEDLGQTAQPEELRARCSYPGPTPTTRESGIIAFADIVEAATRSAGPMTEVDLRAFVRRLMADRIAEGELAHCPLTLEDLARMEEAFFSWLKGRNHVRPAYPVAPAQSTSEPKPETQQDATQAEAEVRSTAEPQLGQVVEDVVEADFQDLEELTDTGAYNLETASGGNGRLHSRNGHGERPDLSDPENLERFQNPQPHLNGRNGHSKQDAETAVPVSEPRS